MGDAFLSGLVTGGQVSGNLELDSSGKQFFRLLLASGRAGTIPTVSEEGGDWKLTAQLETALAATAQQLTNPLQQLRQAWRPATGDSPWDQVAPSLVGGWLLGHVGALQFLQAVGLTASAVDLGAAELERSVALSFLRVSESNGVAHLLGGPYASGWLVRQVLNQPTVLSTLGSADAEGELIMYTTEPLRLLHAFVEEDRKAFYPSTYRLTLPVLSAASLQTMAEPLALVSRKMGDGWSQLVDLARQCNVAAAMTPGQWLRFYSYCVGGMTTSWLEQQLLPPVVPFQPHERGGWFRRRRTQTEQQPPCGLCFWRDVDAMWELGQAWV